MDLASRNRSRLFMSTPHHTTREAAPANEPQAPIDNENEEDLNEIPKHSVHTLMFRSIKKGCELFSSNTNILPPIDKSLKTFKYSVKARDQYKQVLKAVPNSAEKLQIDKNTEKLASSQSSQALVLVDGKPVFDGPAPIDELKSKLPTPKNSQVAVISSSEDSHIPKPGENAVVLASGLTIAPRKRPEIPKPDWHAPWKLFRVISGHTGWVRSIAVDPSNEWFATGSTDRIIKIWDLSSGKLKLSLTGHISPVRGLAVSTRQPYLFSCGEDKQVKCWDLEYNKVIRHYHGHLSGVYSLALHPTLDVLVSAGRDSVARVWDMRSKMQIHALSGHSNTVGSVLCEATDPQVITASYDSTIKLWDLAAGKSMTTLTNHKKSVRAIVSHPKLRMFCSGSINSLKQWRLPEGNFIQNFNGHDAIINAMAANSNNVVVSGADNGSMFLWDWRTGYNFQRIQAIAQPGSIESENGIFALCFDKSESRLISGEADKTIKIYKEDENATEDSHPIDWKPDIIKRKRF